MTTTNLRLRDQHGEQQLASLGLREPCYSPNRYDRDAATREVTAVVNVATGQGYASGVAHAPGGPLTGLTFGNGLALSQGWNLRYEPLTVTSGPERLSCLPSPSGDVSQISDTSQVLSGCFRSAPRDFQYDFLDRLASSPNWLSYGFDGNGNRLAETVEGAAATGQWTYTISDPSGSPLSELALVGGAWVKVRDYVWLDGRPLAQVEYPTASTAYTYYLHADAIGLPRAMTNPAGQLVWNTQPRPFGDVVEKTATDPVSGRVVVTNLRLPGQYDERLLASVGLQGPYYNWNRWYLPGMGRYLELDPPALFGLLDARGVRMPLAPQWYAYADGNPVRYDDLFGLDRYKACENPDLRWFARWMCKKSVDWRCKSTPGEHYVCCDADRNDCRNKVDPCNEMALAECEVAFQVCMADFKDKKP